MDAAIDRLARLRGTRKGVFPRIVATLALAGTLGPLAVSNAVAALGQLPSQEPLSAGTVYLRSDAGGRAMLSMPNGGPGDSKTSYITIDYQGSLPAGVRLYASTSGTGLAQFLRVTVTRGTGEGPAFVQDSINYVGAGPGVVYSGTLADFPSRWENAIVDPGDWTQSESHSYRFVVRLGDDPAAQGLAARTSFHWEARPV
ncbi:MAG TPA: hypothetical protein VF382_01075 [Actinomycetota bacterium]